MRLEFLNPSNLSWANFDMDWCWMLLCCIPCRFPKEQLWRQAEDFLWDYSRLFGTKKETWGYRNTVEATKLTQGDKTQPACSSLPSWGNASLLRMRNVKVVYICYSLSLGHLLIQMEHLNFLIALEKNDGITGEAFSAAGNRHLGWNEAELIQYWLTPRGQVSWAEVKYCCNRQATAWERDWNRVR